MTKSMTGFASGTGAHEGWAWAWDIRAVNARGYDLRLRLPDWLGGLEQPLRAAFGKVVARGNVTVNLRVSRAEEAADETLDSAALARVIGNLAAIDDAAEAAGVLLGRATAADILQMRGVLSAETAVDDPEPLIKAILDDLPSLLDAFDAMRGTEGAALASVISGQLDQIERLTAEASALAEARRDQAAAKLRENLARVLDNADGADPDRVAQELALIAVKADVTEEIDRLDAHVAAARELLASDGARGRKLDFLAQEFNREANTLCSKAQANDLTRVGLDLKAVIDQMREQVQNVE